MPVPSGLVQFKKVGQKSPEVTQFQDNCEQTFNRLTNKQILDGVLLEDVVLTTAALNVSHGLGRPVTGYMVIKRNANAVVYDNESSNTKKTQFLILRASATVTVSLWVF
jgi:hypothetical protein